VSVWASARVPSKAVSARHADSARKHVARLRRPLAGPDIKIKIPQRIHTLGDWFPAFARKTSLMELKQLWLMSR
jgi:hypothetical protein